MTAEHVCDATVPVCTCGYRWAYLRRWAGGKVTYTTETVRQRYLALYGEPEIPFEAAS